jgi:hypothetical protein
MRSTILNVGIHTWFKLFGTVPRIVSWADAAFEIQNPGPTLEIERGAPSA